MDPAFANVLKRMPGGSPLRPSPLAGQRDPVSPSPQPPPLDRNLVVDRHSVLEELEEEMPTMVVAKETSKMSAQTDPEEPPEVPVHAKVPVPVPVVKPKTAESAMQTDEPEPVPEPIFGATYAEEGVATNSEAETMLPPCKAMAEADMQTDVEPEEIEIPIQSAGPVVDVLQSMVISREEWNFQAIALQFRSPSGARRRRARPVGMIVEDVEALLLATAISS